MKRFTSLLIVALCFTSASSAYDPLTEAEALQYVEQYPERAAVDIMRLEAIENGEPTVEMPQYVITEQANGRERTITVSPRSPLVVSVGHVGWRITLRDIESTFESIVDPFSWRSAAIGAGVGIVAATIGLLLIR